MDSAQLLELIKKRRSIRSYLPDPIPDEHINKILEAGLYAPSGKIGNHGDSSLLRK